MYYTFCLKDKNGEAIHPSHRHAGHVSKFLGDEATYDPAFILDAWFRNADGRVNGGLKESKHMFSTTIHFTDIKSVWVVLTSFAIQTVCDQLVKEADNAVKPSNGLHISVKNQSD